MIEDDNGGWKRLDEILLADGAYEYIREHELLKIDFNAAKDYFSKLQVLSAYYLRNEKAIIDLGNRSRTAYYNTYPIDWVSFFTPIEREAWNCIKGKGIVFYPQYPALNYYLDFANPAKKIALELDGKDYHNPVKDKQRDIRLKLAGWTVYRIPGVEIFKAYKDFSDCYEEGIVDENEKYVHIKHWIMETGNGVIEAIKVVDFRDPPNDETDIEERMFYEGCLESLQNHSLVKIM